MAKTSASIDLASKVPASYVTDITNSNGIFVHEKSDSSVSPTDSGANGVQITDKVKIIRDGRSVAEYGEDIIIGKKLTSEDSAHEVESLLTLNKNSMCLLSGAKDYLSDNKIFEISINTLKKNYKVKLDGTTPNTSIVTHTVNSTVYVDQITITDSSFIQQIEKIKDIIYDELEADSSNFTMSGSSIVINFPNDYAPYKGNPVNLNIVYIPNLNAVSYTANFLANDEYWVLRTRFTLPATATNIISVQNVTTGTEITDYIFDTSAHQLIIPATPTEENALPQDTEITVSYRKTMGYFYSLGKRDLTETGDFSVATGNNCLVKGANSFGGGNNTYVSGNNSFGYGYGTGDDDCVSVTGAYSGAIGRGLTVNGSGSFACGKFNDSGSSYAFMVGNGQDAYNRNNAFWVARSGNARVAGDLAIGKRLLTTGEIRSYNAAGTSTTPLFWYDTKRKSNISVPANNTNTGLTCDITLPNRIPMGIVGMRILNSSSNGANASNCNLYIYMIVHNSSEDHITFSIKNFASTAAKVDVEFKIFYIANGALNSQIQWT